MQTFLPYSDFDATAKVLDMRRLGKQRIEGYQILVILLNRRKSKAWRNHPAVLMWEGYESCLAKYIISICKEWIGRGYKDTILQKTYDLCKIFCLNYEYPTNPLWLGREDFHLSHKSNLIRKMPERYKFVWFDVSDNLPYIWPTKHNFIGESK